MSKTATIIKYNILIIVSNDRVSEIDFDHFDHDHFDHDHFDHERKLKVSSRKG